MWRNTSKLTTITHTHTHTHTWYVSSCMRFSTYKLSTSQIHRGHPTPPEENCRDRYACAVTGSKTNGCSSKCHDHCHPPLEWRVIHLPTRALEWRGINMIRISTVMEARSLRGNKSAVPEGLPKCVKQILCYPVRYCVFRKHRLVYLYLKAYSAKQWERYSQLFRTVLYNSEPTMLVHQKMFFVFFFFDSAA